MRVGLGGFQGAQASLYHALEVFRKGGAIVWHPFFHRRIKIHQLGSIPHRHLWTYTDRPRVCLMSAIFALCIFAGGPAPSYGEEQMHTLSLRARS